MHAWSHGSRPTYAIVHVPGSQRKRRHFYPARGPGLAPERRVSKEGDHRTIDIYIYIYLASDSSQDHILTEGLAVLAPISALWATAARLHINLSWQQAEGGRAGPGISGAAGAFMLKKTSNSVKVRLRGARCIISIKFAFDSLHRLERKRRLSAQLCLLYGVLTTLWHCVITDNNWNVVSPFRPRHRSSLSCQATDQASWSWCCGRCAYRINRIRRCQLDKSFWARKQVQNGKMCEAKFTLCGACWCNFQLVLCAMLLFDGQ